MYFLETICGWQKNVPTPSKKKKKVNVLIPGICEYMISCGKNIFADVTLEWKESLDYPAEPSIKTTEVLKKGLGRESETEKEMRGQEAETGVN